MTTNRPLSIPVILGTTSKGRMSAHAARFMVEQIQKRPCISTDLIDLSDLPMPIDDAGEEIKDSTFSNRMTIADALVIVTPEYNHSFPGLLKHVLDSCLKEYSRRHRRCIGWTFRRRACDSGFPAGDSRARVSQHFLGRQFRQCRQRIRPIGQPSRSSVYQARR